MQQLKKLNFTRFFSIFLTYVIETQHCVMNRDDLKIIMHNGIYFYIIYGIVIVIGVD